MKFIKKLFLSIVLTVSSYSLEEKNMLTPGDYVFNDNLKITSNWYGSTISGNGNFKINADGYTITFTKPRNTDLCYIF